MRWTIKEPKTEWHRWFAWHPVKVEHQYVWLEKVYRKGQRVPYGWDYDYRVEGSEIGAR
jgi:hypothetical protein